MHRMVNGEATWLSQPQLKTKHSKLRCSTGDGHKSYSISQKNPLLLPCLALTIRGYVLWAIGRLWAGCNDTENALFAMKPGTA